MAKEKLTNINDYTLTNASNTKIIFYPINAFYKAKVKSQDKSVIVSFELKKEKEEKIYSTHISLVNEENETLYTSYQMYLVELSKNRYALISSKNNVETKASKYKETIDFNVVGFKNFFDFINNNQKLSKMLPILTQELKHTIESFQAKKKTIKLISESEIFNYYQNISGFIINELEAFLTIPEEEELRETILNNISSNSPVIFNNKTHLKVTYLSLFAFIVNKVKSEYIKPESILEKKHLKVELDNSSISKKEFDLLIPNILNTKDKKNNSELLESINKYISYDESKKIINKLKVLIANDIYLDETSATRYTKEPIIKDLVLKSFTNLWFYPLPQNQVLIYNYHEDVIDFLYVASTDMVFELLNSYKKTAVKEEYKEYHHLIKPLTSLITETVEKKTQSFIRIYFLTLIISSIYNYKHLENTAYLFNNGDYIIDLSFDKGKYKITLCNKHNNKKYGHFSKITDVTKDKLAISLKAGEKEFTKHINDIIYTNIHESLFDLRLIIKSDEISHKGITFTLNQNKKEDVLDLTLTAEDLLLILSNIKASKKEQLVKKEPEVKKEIKPIKRNVSEKEETAILRKCHTIVEIMKKQNLDNEKYRKVVKLYKEYNKSNPKRKDEILIELKELI